jgi:hypothetical protein
LRPQHALAQALGRYRLCKELLDTLDAEWLDVLAAAVAGEGHGRAAGDGRTMNARQIAALPDERAWTSTS